MFKDYFVDEHAQEKIENTRKLIMESGLFDRDAELPPAKSLDM
ncbi:hypothetical protein [Heliorestis convoluta]|nr:hypothetical protein [Heliorestis convoluta]